jgi:hypothetical protein
LNKITKENISESPDNYVYIFGDNLLKIGLGGQAAVARQFVSCNKTFGIPTKRKPTSEEDAFFSDKQDEIDAVRESLRHIDELRKQQKVIVFFPNIGEGLAELPTRSPKIFKIITNYTNKFK